MMRSRTFILSAALSLAATSLAQAEASCEISRGPVELAQTRALNDAARRGGSSDARTIVDKRRASRVAAAPVR